MSAILSTLGIYIILISTIYCRKFGYNNSLTCNCNNETSCQDSGMCTYGGCKPGWSGPTCQKENVARHKPANQSSYYRQDWPSSRGVDGDKSTFVDMITSKQGWWLVDLLQNYLITEITLYHRPRFLFRLRGFSVYIIGEDLVSTLCYHHTNEPLTDGYNIRCNSTGRYINITSAINPDYPNDTNPHAILHLSEVEIYVCSAGTYGKNCTEFCHCSQYTRCDDITGYCKGGCLAWWYGNSCNQSCSVRNSYGDGCKFHCDDRKCNGTSQCDHVTGACLYGCQDGWESQDCTRVCSPGSYGGSCQQPCSGRNCKSSDLKCNHVNGTCVGGCKAGWTSDDCTLLCSQGSYGGSCHQLCSDRNCKSSDSTCNHVNGTCVGGCLAGWTSDDCTLGIVRNGEPDSCSSLHPIVIGVIGAVFGVAVTLVAVIIIYCIYFKRRRKREEVVPDNVIYVNVDVDTETIENGNSNITESVIISQATVSENQTVQPPNEYETLDQSSVHSPTYTSLQ